MQTCLVLFSGLPGAGKTTLSRAVLQLLTPMCCERDILEARPCVFVDAVLELDEFLQNEMENDMQANDTSFNPEAWLRASKAMRNAVFERLSRCFLDAQKGDVATRFVFLVDTLPYRSMRAAYWKMCRNITNKQLLQKFKDNIAKDKKPGDNSQDKGPFVSMVEVRVNTPVEICIESNETRRKTSNYIPPQVIRGMDASFDLGVGTSAIFLDENNSWIVVPCQAARPWPIVLLNNGEKSSRLSPALLAKELLDRLLSNDVFQEVERQHKSIVETQIKCQEKEVQDQGRGDMQTPSTAQQLHQFDLRMRAAVGNYMKGLKRTGSLRPEIGRLVRKCREEHYAQARKAVLEQKQQMRHKLFCGLQSEAMLQDLISEFEQNLSFL